MLYGITSAPRAPAASATVSGANCTHTRTHTHTHGLGKPDAMTMRTFAKHISVWWRLSRCINLCARVCTCVCVCVYPSYTYLWDESPCYIDRRNVRLYKVDPHAYCLKGNERCEYRLQLSEAPSLQQQDKEGCGRHNDAAGPQRHFVVC